MMMDTTKHYNHNRIGQWTYQLVLMELQCIDLYGHFYIYIIMEYGLSQCYCYNSTKI